MPDNESDQPAVKRAEVGEAAITMSEANRRAAKPTSHDGSVASYCYVAPFSSMVHHMTLTVRVTLKNHIHEDEEPQQSSRHDDHSETKPSERPASKIVISTEVSSQARTYIASRNANHHNEPVGLVATSKMNTSDGLPSSSLATHAALRSSLVSSKPATTLAT